MTYYFSASKKGFFSSDIHGDKMPSDAREISQKEAEDVFAAAAMGKVIVGDQYGKPIAIDHVLTEEETLFAAKQQSIVDLAKSDVTLLRCIESGVGIPTDWVVYRAQLRECAAGKRSNMPERPQYPEGT